MAQDFGILSVGAYLPRTRLQRSAIHAANSWFAPGLRGAAKGERAIANWDEDAITLGVEAATDCLSALALKPTALVLASTSHPFADRQNAGVVADALGIAGEGLRAQDMGGSMRAGTSALMNALERGAQVGASLVVAAEHRRTKVASPQEMAYGDGAAAVLVGRGSPIATVVATHSESLDFVHSFRMADHSQDYGWEERWVREEGYLTIVPRAVSALLDKAGVSAQAVTHFCLPCALPKVGAAVAKKLGFREASVRDNLSAVCGDTGAAHALLMLAHALQQAQAGDLIVVASFGQGCDALLVEVTPEVKRLQSTRGVEGALAHKVASSNYLRFLAFNGLVDMERGMRSETDKGTPLTSAYRNHAMLQGLMGGRCRHCATVQFPMGRYCVEPSCKALDSQDPHSFASSKAKVVSYTADLLTYSPDPPAWYGMVQFKEGGRMLIDFSEVESVEVGDAMRMAFRIKDQDTTRGYVRYFWKAVPDPLG